MKAIVWSEYGAPEDVLEPQEVDEPAVGDDGVLVRIRATTVAGDGWHLVRGLPCLARIATALFAPKKNVTTRSGAIMKRRLSRLAIVSCFFALTTAQLSAQNEEWTRPFPSHRVISNLYTVGTYGLGVFLITTDKGHILINTGLEDSTPLIRENIEAVGFRLEDVKILLTMQAHWDHTAALAEIKQITGAKMLATKDDARVLEDGGFSDAHFGGRESFKPVSVDQIIGEGEVIELGDTRLTVYEGQVLIFLSNLRMVPRARLSCWFLRRAFGEELVSKFLDSPDCENIHPYAAPFTRCGQQDCEREFYRGLLGKEVRNDFRPTFEFSEGALE